MGKYGNVIMVFCLASALASGCGREEEPREESSRVTAGDVKEQAQQTYESAKLYSQEQIEEFQGRTKQELEEYGQKLDRLTERLEGLQAGAKEDLKQRIEEMRQKRDRAYAEFRELTSSSGQAWAELKSGVEGAMAELSRSYDRAKAEFDPNREGGTGHSGQLVPPNPTSATGTKLTGHHADRVGKLTRRCAKLKVNTPDLAEVTQRVAHTSPRNARRTGWSRSWMNRFAKQRRRIS